MLRRLWHRWKEIAHQIGTFQARVLLNVFYLLILTPFALAVRLLADPLHLQQQRHSQWLPKEPPLTSRWEQARRQF
jgi:hypothetical protein